jgi:hypothetical protein
MMYGFDEAHDMEDGLREAASVTLNLAASLDASSMLHIRRSDIGGAEPYTLGELVSENGNYEMYGVN